MAWPNPQQRDAHLSYAHPTCADILGNFQAFQGVILVASPQTSGKGSQEQGSTGHEGDSLVQRGEAQMWTEFGQEQLMISSIRTGPHLSAPHHGPSPAHSVEVRSLQGDNAGVRLQEKENGSHETSRNFLEVEGRRSGTSQGLPRSSCHSTDTLCGLSQHSSSLSDS